MQHAFMRGFLCSIQVGQLDNTGFVFFPLFISSWVFLHSLNLLIVTSPKYFKKVMKAKSNHVTWALSCP